MLLRGMKRRLGRKGYDGVVNSQTVTPGRLEVIGA